MFDLDPEGDYPDEAFDPRWPTKKGRIAAQAVVLWVVLAVVGVAIVVAFVSWLVSSW
jgi:preprotein translocase subunit SecE